MRCSALDRPCGHPVAHASGVLAGRALGALALVAFRAARVVTLLILGSTRAPDVVVPYGSPAIVLRLTPPA